MEVLQSVLGTVFQPGCLVALVAGVLLGIVFGACPGISTSMGIALILPFTYSLSIAPSMGVLVGLYIGGVSGGLISAILLNIPGTPGSICTTFDGHPMAAKGEAGRALGIGMLYSFLGGILSLILLISLSPLLASFALKFTAVEYFAITLFSFLLIASLSGKSLLKGLIATLLGLVFTTVGIDPIDGAYRYTFGIHSLDGGFQLVTAVIGLYAVAAILNVSEFDSAPVKIRDYNIRGFGVDRKTFLKQVPNMFRSTIIGTFVGLLPGLGANIANVLSYTTSKKMSKTPEIYGTGCVDGLVASESSNNAVTGGAMIPLLTLGIPGDAGTSLLLAALTIHGIQAGPLLFTKQPTLVYSIFLFMLIANLVMLLAEYFGMKGFLKIITIPQHILFPIIIMICMIGAFSTNNRIFDVWAVVFFAVVAYGLRKFGFPIPPFILGFVLGNLFEKNFRRAVMYTNGTIAGLADYPIALFFILVFFLFTGYMIIKTVVKKKRS